MQQTCKVKTNIKLVPVPTKQLKRGIICRPVAIVDKSINRTIKKNDLDNFSGRDNFICILVCYPRLNDNSRFLSIGEVNPLVSCIVFCVGRRRLSVTWTLCGKAGVFEATAEKSEKTRRKL